MRRLISVSVPLAGPGQSFGPAQDLFLFAVGQLGKTAAALDAFGVAGQEPIDDRLREA